MKKGDLFADIAEGCGALENREPSWAKPDAQAALLVRLVETFPDTVKRLVAV